MRVKIKDIARVISGYLFKSSPPPAKRSNIYFVDHKDLAASKTIYLDIGSLQKIDFDKTTTELMPKDILFANRGSYLVRVLPNFKDRRIIAREFLTIIRPDEKLIIPEFLYIKLREKSTMENIIKKASGRAAKFIKVSTLKEIEIEAPDLSTQKKIVSAYIAIEKLKIAHGTKLASIDYMQESIGRSFLPSFEKEKKPLEDSILSFMKIDPAIGRLTNEMKHLLHNLDIKA
jgi:restriction endonuclease S subunit